MFIVLYFLYICRKRKLLKLSVDTYKVSGIPLRAVKKLWLFPGVIALFQIGISILFINLWVSTMKSGKSIEIRPPKFNTTEEFPSEFIKTIRMEPIYFDIHWFYIIIYLWWMAITLQFNRYVIASCTASWYFSREKSILN